MNLKQSLYKANENSAIKSLYIYALAITNIGAVARIFDIVFQPITYVCMAFIFLSIAASIWISIYRRDIITIIAFVPFIFAVIYSKIAYSAQAGVDFSLIGGMDTAICVQFVVFRAIKADAKKILDAIYITSIFYILIYIYSSYALTSFSTKEMAEMSGVMGADSARESSRLALASSFAGFIIYYAVGSLRIRFSLHHVGAAALGIVALVLSQSRTVQLITAATLIFFVPSKFIQKTATIFASVAFVAVFLVFCTGFADYRFNPFVTLSHDDSAWARANEYAAAIRILSEHPLTGAGLGPVTTFEYQMYIQSGSPFFPQDLGALGVWVAYGMPGLILFFLCTYLCFFWWRHFDVREPMKSVLFSVGIMNGLYGIIAPTIFMASGRVFLAVFIFLYLEHLSRRRVARHSAVPANVGPSLTSGIDKKPFASAS